MIDARELHIAYLHFAYHVENVFWLYRKGRSARCRFCVGARSR